MNMESVALPALFAFVVTLLMVQLLRRLGAQALADDPNERSLHSVSVPRIGGLAIMVGVAATAPWWWGEHSWRPVLATFAVGLISSLDDRRDIPFQARLLVHVGAALALWLTLGLSGWVLVGFTIVTVASANLYNFMDGADGLAGGMAMLGFGALAVALAPLASGSAWAAEAEGARQVTQLCLTIAAASGAFLCFNWPPAKVFLGDAGSVPLGFLAAVVAGYAAVRGWLPWWAGPSLFAPFLLDSVTTLLARLWRGEKIWRPHRQHLYQRLVLGGWSHQKLATAAYTWMASCALATLLAIRYDAWFALAAFHCVMTTVVWLVARSHAPARR
jgi:UDP-GlcNAc:undecaprenyl-phosphate/decaprenyl-phosphate GlcNAc-1-phosphate transferase